MAPPTNRSNAELLDLARTAVHANPLVTVGDFRAQLQAAQRADKKAAGAQRRVAEALKVAKLETNPREFDLALVGDSFKDLVQAPTPPAPEALVSLDRVEPELLEAVDAGLAGARQALERVADRLRASAAAAVAEERQRYIEAVGRAEQEAADLASQLDELRALVARAEANTSSVRQELGAKVGGLENALAESERNTTDLKRQLTDATDRRELAERKLLEVQTSNNELNEQFRQSERRLGVAATQAETLQKQVDRLDQHLAREREALHDARQAVTSAVERAARAEAASDAAEVNRERQVKSLETQVADLTARLSARATGRGAG